MTGWNTSTVFVDCEEVCLTLLTEPRLLCVRAIDLFCNTCMRLTHFIVIIRVLNDLFQFYIQRRTVWTLLNRFRTEQGHCGACRRKWRLTDTDLCPCGETQTMSHIVKSCPLTKLAAYLGYTLRMRTLFRGWPIMVDDMHTRRRRYKGGA